MWNNILFSRLLSIFILGSLVISMGCIDDNDNNNDAGFWKDLTTFCYDIDDSMPQRFRYLSNTSNIAHILNPTDTIVFLIGVETTLLPGDINGIINYASKGGTFVYSSDNVEMSSALASELGILYYDHLLQDSNYLYNLAFVVSTLEHPDNMEVLFNSPKGLNTTDQGNYTTEKILSTSPICVERPEQERPYISSKSFVDINDNGLMDSWDIDLHGPIALAYRIDVGEGQVYFFGDTGPFLNGIYEKCDNREYFRNIIESSVSTDGTIYLDITHHLTSNSGKMKFPAI